MLFSLLAHTARALTAINYDNTQPGNRPQSTCIKRRLQPLHHTGFNADHVKTARRQAGKAQQIVTRGKHNVPLFGGGDAGRRTTVTGSFALTHFNKHAGAVWRAHDQVDFATTAAGGSIIALL